MHAKGKSVFSLRECAGNEPVPRRVSLTFKGHGRKKGRDASTPHDQVRWMISDTQTDMLLGEPKSAICVQIFDDSLNSAIHTTYRTWLRSSSMHEPRDPPLKVVSFFFFLYVVKQRRTFSSSSVQRKHNERGWSSARTTQRHLKAQVYPTVRLVKVHST